MNKKIILACIATSDYIAQFRNKDKFIEFCKVCNNYKSLWSCPPFDTGICCKVDDINKFSYTTIIGVKINLDESTRYKSTTIEERDLLIRDILSEVRREFDNKLLILEQQIQPSRLYHAGSCRLCTPNACSRVDNMPCRYPNKMRSTLEAIGFDMGRTTSELLGVELKWCDGLMLPPYFTLVYGLLSDCDVLNKVKEYLQI